MTADQKFEKALAQTRWNEEEKQRVRAVVPADGHARYAASQMIHGNPGQPAQWAEEIAQFAQGEGGNARWVFELAHLFFQHTYDSSIHPALAQVRETAPWARQIGENNNPFWSYDTGAGKGLFEQHVPTAPAFQAVYRSISTAAAQTLSPAATYLSSLDLFEEMSEATPLPAVQAVFSAAENTGAAFYETCQKGFAFVETYCAIKEISQALEGIKTLAAFAKTAGPNAGFVFETAYFYNYSTPQGISIEKIQTLCAAVTEAAAASEKEGTDPREVFSAAIDLLNSDEEISLETFLEISDFAQSQGAEASTAYHLAKAIHFSDGDCSIEAFQTLFPAFLSVIAAVESTTDKAIAGVTYASILETLEDAQIPADILEPLCGIAREEGKNADAVFGLASEYWNGEKPSLKTFQEIYQSISSVAHGLGDDAADFYEQAKFLLRARPNLSPKTISAITDLAKENKENIPQTFRLATGYFKSHSTLSGFLKLHQTIEEMAAGMNGHQATEARSAMTQIVARGANIPMPVLQDLCAAAKKEAQERPDEFLTFLDLAQRHTTSASSPKTLLKKIAQEQALTRFRNDAPYERSMPAQKASDAPSLEIGNEKS